MSSMWGERRGGITKECTMLESLQPMSQDRSLSSLSVKLGLESWRREGRGSEGGEVIDISSSSSPFSFSPFSSSSSSLLSFLSRTRLLAFLMMALWAVFSVRNVLLIRTARHSTVSGSSMSRSFWRIGGSVFCQSSLICLRIEVWLVGVCTWTHILIILFLCSLWRSLKPPPFPLNPRPPPGFEPEHHQSLTFKLNQKPRNFRFKKIVFTKDGSGRPPAHPGPRGPAHRPMLGHLKVFWNWISLGHLKVFLNLISFGIWKLF